MSSKVRLSALFVALCLPLLAQINPQLMTQVPIEVVSGPVSNPALVTQVVWSQTLTVPTASSVQLYFEVADLGDPRDELVVTSVTDQQSQVLNQTVLKQWRNHSAWFNGPMVTIELRLLPGSTGQVASNTAFIFQSNAVPPVTNDSQCGSTDDRVPSADGRVCRLLGNGYVCTGWLINGQNLLLSAGHCGIPASTSALVTAEFNVPSSTAGGSIVNPPIADQFPVDQTSISAHQTAIGDDYSVMRLHPNSTGQTALQHQGAGSFSLAGSLPLYLPPFIIPTLRVTGCGADVGARNFVQQTDNGPSTGYSGNTIFHQVDTEGGDSGAPIIDDSTGLAIGIHTNAGCGVSSGSNSGTSILNSGLAAAISSVGTCGNTSLTNGSPAAITCTPRSFNTTTASNDWTIVAESPPSTGDWDMHIEGVSSAAGTGTCDYLVANGNFGTVNPISGEIFLFGGTGNPTAEFQIATTIQIDQQTFGNFSSAEVVELYQFNVTAAGTYDVVINGDQGLGWNLFAPGSNNSWRPRFGTGYLTSGTVGGAPVTGISLSTGWHCLVIFKNNGPGGLGTSALTVSVCTSVPPITLAQGGAQNVTSACQRFTLTPSATNWNVVGVSSQSDWDIALGAGQSHFGGNSCDFVVSNGHFGAPLGSSGVVVRFAGTDDATAEFVTAGTGSLDVPFESGMSAGEIVRLVQFNVPAAGSYDLMVSGDPSLEWDLFGPGTDANWRGRGLNSGNGSVAAPTVTVSLSVGWHAIVISHPGGALAASASFSIHLCSPTAPVNLASTINATPISSPCQQFTMFPSVGNWNAVGVTSSSDWDIAVGQVESQFGTGTCDFLVSNGTLGAITPLTGVASRYSGATGASVGMGTIVTVTPGTAYSASWGAGQAIRVFQFSVPTADSYDITVSGLAGLSWTLFDPGTDAAWRTRSTSIAGGALSSAVTTRNLTAGSHAIVVTVDTGVGVTGGFTVDVHLTPNPVPVLSSIAPSSAIAGSGGLTLNCSGSGFFAGSIVRWDGGNLPTTFVSATSVTATLTAPQVATAGTHTVTVFNATPGGGTTAGLTFTVNNPVPGIASLSPSHLAAGGVAFTLTVNGSNFNAQSVVRWNGVGLTTTLVNAGQVTAAVPAANIAFFGAVPITVFTPAPGGGTTSALIFTIDHPVPTLSSISPTTRTAGGATFTLTLNGTGYDSATQATWNGTPLTTSFVSVNQVTASVPAANIALGGPALVRAVNPTPGGGTSSSLTLTINNPVPTLATISPASVNAGTGSFGLAVTGTNYNAQSQIRWNGAPLTTTFVSATQLSASVPAANIASPGTASITVFNPAPAGGTSAALTETFIGPAITSIAPGFIAIKTPASPPTTLTVSGSGYLAGSKVFANGVQLTTVFVNANQLTAQLPATVLQTQALGGLWIGVQNFPQVASNLWELVVGGGSNHGVVGHVPLTDPETPGSTFSLNIEGCAPNAPFILVGDTGMPAPIGAWPTPAADLVLSVGSAGLFSILDGIGIFGPAVPGVVTTPNQPGNTPPGGKFILTGLTAPNPALGLHFTMQVAYIDPASPVGFRLTWAFVDTSI